MDGHFQKACGIRQECLRPKETDYQWGKDPLE